MPNETQPSPSNPLGNPPYPGYTSSNGPNWVDFLTVEYNASLLQTVNLAYGGATVDANLVAQYLPTVLDFNQQVNEEFIPYYAGSNRSVDWSSDDTLFAYFFGINDVGNSYAPGKNTSALNAQIFAEYASLVDQTYQAGARSFLFLNVPPVNRSPLTIAEGVSAETAEFADIEAFNAGVTAIAANLSATYSDATVFEFDTNALFTDVLGDVDLYPQTSGYQNVTTYCPAYEK